jgi:5-methylcytosine-specific restriction endonuclease McrA
MATYINVCLYCKRPFEAAHSLANICSPACQQDARNAGRTRLPPRPAPDGAGAGKIPPEPPEMGRPIGEADRRCLRCGKAVGVDDEMKRYCSPACRKAVQRRARKARIRGAYVEAVSVAVLGERDRGACGICGEPVDFTTKAPHPAAATIDHVVPLARGGEHSYRNTQLAHYKCNSAKGAG